MKLIFNTPEEFERWLEKMMSIYSVKTKKTPSHYPCIIAAWSIENDYVGRDWLEFLTIYQEDFEIRNML